MNYKEEKIKNTVRRLLSPEKFNRKIKRLDETRRWGWHHLTEVVPEQVALKSRYIVEAIVRCLFTPGAFFSREAALWINAHIKQPLVLAVLYYEAAIVQVFRDQLRNQVHGPMFLDDLPENVRPLWKMIITSTNEQPILWQDVAKHFAVPRNTKHQPDDLMVYAAVTQVMEPTPIEAIPDVLRAILTRLDWKQDKNLVRAIWHTLDYKEIDTSKILTPYVKECWNYLIALTVLVPNDLSQLETIQIVRLMQTEFPSCTPEQQSAVVKAITGTRDMATTALIPEILEHLPDTDIGLLELYDPYKFIECHWGETCHKLLLSREAVIAKLPIERAWKLFPYPKSEQHYDSRWWWDNPLVVRIVANATLLQKMGHKILTKDQSRWTFLADYLSKLPEDMEPVELTYWLNNFARSWPMPDQLDRVKNILLLIKQYRINPEPLFSSTTAQLFFELQLPIDDYHFINCDFVPQNRSSYQFESMAENEAIQNKLIQLAKTDELLIGTLWNWALRQSGNSIYLFIEWLSTAKKRRPGIELQLIKLQLAQSNNYCRRALFCIIHESQLRNEITVPERQSLLQQLNGDPSLFVYLLKSKPNILYDWYSPVELVDCFFTFKEGPASCEEADFLFKQEKRECERLGLTETATPLNVRARLLGQLLEQIGKCNDSVWLRCAAVFRDDVRIQHIALINLEKAWDDERLQLALDILWPDHPAFSTP